MVGDALDGARLTRVHAQVFALIAAGYYVDVSDYVIYGSMIPLLLEAKFATRGALALVGSAQLIGLALGTFFQGPFSDRLGRKATYQFNLLLFGVATIVGAFAPNAAWLAATRFVAGLGILSLIHFVGGALSWPISALLALSLGSAFGWRVLWASIGVFALVIFLLRFSLPESPRWLAARGRSQAAFAVLARMNLPAVPTGIAGRPARQHPFLQVWRSYPGRLVAAMAAMSAFFCVTIGFGTWLPNIMRDEGFTIAKSLTFSFGMMLAAPCASLFMMATLDRFGRKRTATVAFVAAGLAAVAFSGAGSNLRLLLTGFAMIFCYQLAGNTMQIFTSEVFPTSARASGFGMAAGIGRLATAGFIPLLPVIQARLGLQAVFVTLATLLCTAAITLNFIGPETRQRSLEELATTDDAVLRPAPIPMALVKQDE